MITVRTSLQPVLSHNIFQFFLGKFQFWLYKSCSVGLYQTNQFTFKLNQGVEFVLSPVDQYDIHLAWDRLTLG